MRAERLVALLFTLQRKRSATAAELAEELGVSERTMHRDIAALQGAGVPLWTEPGRHGGVRLVEGWRSRLDGLTSREAVAIFAMGVPRALTELGLGTAVAAAHAKVSATLPAPLREQAQEVAQRFHLDAPGWFRKQDTDGDTGALATVAGAVWSQRRLRITYRRGEQSVEREVDPLGLVLKAGVWYLVALVADADTIRTYRVARISAAGETAEHFDRPTDFDLASWWQQSSTQFERTLFHDRVRLRLSPAGMRMLTGFIDAEVALAALESSAAPDADGWTEVDLRMERQDIALSQLLGFGGEVEILEPARLRAAFAETARAMAARNS